MNKVDKLVQNLNNIINNSDLEISIKILALQNEINKLEVQKCKESLVESNYDERI